MKNGKNTPQCGSTTRTADQCSRTGYLAAFPTSQHCAGVFPEPSADALRASADEPSRTQYLANFRKFQRSRFHPQCGSAICTSIRTQSYSKELKKETCPSAGEATRSAGQPSALDPQRAKNCPVWQFFYFWRIVDAF